MNVSTCPNPKELKELSLGLLPTSHSDSLFEHIDTCDQCQQALETLSDKDDSLIVDLRNAESTSNSEDAPEFRMAIARALELAPNISGFTQQADSAPASTNETQLPATPETPLPDMVGEYKILGAIGKGGMGNVYQAQHTKLGREVALKVLAARRLANLKSKKRFESEMLAIGKLSHPNIVTAYDAREVEGTAVLIMEFIDGVDLGELLKRVGPLPIADACEISQKIAAALEYVSQSGFVHRDIKPSNIMLNREGEAKLLDLGLARLTQVEANSEITATGFVMGTADYVSPEQIRDCRDVDIRSDLYSLGCTLFKLLSGQAPFEGPETATIFAKMTAHNSARPPRLELLRPDVPKALCKLIDDLLSKSPDQRPQNPSDVAQQLRRFSQGSQLKELVTQAIATPISAELPAAPTRNKTQIARTAPWYKKSSGLIAAIATGILGLLLGIYCGVIITIKYPDGTLVKLIAPEGSEVEVSQEGKGKPSLNPQLSSAPNPDMGNSHPNKKKIAVPESWNSRLQRQMQGEHTLLAATIGPDTKTIRNTEFSIRFEGERYTCNWDKALDRSVFGDGGIFEIHRSDDGRILFDFTPEQGTPVSLEFKTWSGGRYAFVDLDGKKIEFLRRDENTSDVVRLQGDWNIDSVNIDGSPKIISAGSTLTFEGYGYRSSLLERRRQLSSLDEAIRKEVFGTNGSFGLARSNGKLSLLLPQSQLLSARGQTRFEPTFQLLFKDERVIMTGKVEDKRVEIELKKQQENTVNADVSKPQPLSSGRLFANPAEKLAQTLQGEWVLHVAKVNNSELEELVGAEKPSFTIEGYQYQTDLDKALGKTIFGAQGGLGLQYQSRKTTLLIIPESKKRLQFEMRIEGQYIVLSGTTEDAFIEIELVKKDDASAPSSAIPNASSANAEPWEEFFKRGLQGEHILESAVFGFETKELGNEKYVLAIDGNQYTSNVDGALGAKLFGDSGTVAVRRSSNGQWSIQLTPQFAPQRTLYIHVSGNGTYAFVMKNMIRLDWRRPTESSRHAAEHSEQKQETNLLTADELTRSLQGEWRLDSALINGAARLVNRSFTLKFEGSSYKSTLDGAIGSELFGQEGEYGVQSARESITLFLTPNNGNPEQLELRLDGNTLKLSGATNDTGVEIELKKLGNGPIDSLSFLMSVQGSWKVTAYAKNRTFVPAEDSDSTLTIKGDRYSSSQFPGLEGLNASGSIELKMMRTARGMIEFISDSNSVQFHAKLENEALVLVDAKNPESTIKLEKAQHVPKNEVDRVAGANRMYDLLHGRWRIVYCKGDKDNSKQSQVDLTEIAFSRRNFHLANLPASKQLTSILSPSGKVDVQYHNQGQVNIGLSSPIGTAWFHVKQEDETLKLVEPKTMQLFLTLERIP